MKVTIYSTKACYYCEEAKNFFKEKGISYETIDVGVDLVERKKMVELSGQMGVPVIVIDSKVFSGFNKEKIENEIESRKKGGKEKK
jgi:glutaredoxin-like YruB-family protein